MAEPMKRREFLKVIGVTGVGAATLGCAAEPASKLIPYLVQPEEIVPGIPTVYASVCRECPAGCGIHAKTREGRAVKLEGNPEHPVNRGKLCARGQAALQGLYNPDRVRGPLRRAPSGTLEPLTWDEAEALLSETIAALLAAGRGNAIAFFGAPENTSFGGLVDAWLSALGARPRVAYDAFGTEALLEANRLSFGVAEIPDFALDEADFVIAFGAEFLETWVSPVEYARRFGARHTFRDGDISKFVFVGPRLSLTAANADEWIATRPGSEMFLALGMARAIVESGWARVPARELA
ncbi:MAG: molybdopterin-dependent oxidoreductase, partial [Gemmatimonadetes bacterium]|nr:molybdopterin-dependent oxidoreductase [Gemmatimonadota bacterium]